jgi:hypothetical protein
MPEDVAQYSTLGDDINRALQAAIAAQGSNGGSSDGGSSTSGVKGTTSDVPKKSTFHGGPTAHREGAFTSAGRDGDGGPVGSALESIGPGSADSVPVPLLVLGGLSILLLTLGAAGFVARRVQTRRAR